MFASWRAISMSVAFLGNDTAMYSTPIAMAVRMSSMSFAVSAGAVSPPPWRLMPLLFESSPPTLTTVWISSPTTRETVSTMSPSLSSSTSPDLRSRGRSL